MGQITPAALAALLNSKIDPIDISSGELENDALILAMSEALVAAFSTNTIFPKKLVNGGVGDSSVYPVANITTLSWNPTPNGTYTSESGTTEFSTIRFTVDTTGGWSITGAGEVLDEAFGRWRPNLDEDLISYEISVTTTGSPVFTTGGITTDGTWATIDNNKTIILTDTFGGGASLTNVQVQIRQRGVPSNSTTVATFVLTSLQEGPV